MGAGKSSIFQAITFALFGSLPEVKSRDIKTTDLINRQAKETHVKLFLSSNQEFAILRSIDQKGTGNATVRDSQDQLVAGPKPTAATAFINQLLKTDLDTFLRTVYAKQNEIDLFLKYSPADRKRYIDELMKLDTFEKARKHSTQLQNKLKVRLEESQKLLETTDKEKLASDINHLSIEVANLELAKKTASAHIETARNNEQIIKQKLDLLREKKSKVDGLQQNLTLLSSQISQLKEKLKDIKILESKQELDSKIQKLRAELQTLVERERQLAVLASREKDLKTRQEDIGRLQKEAKEIDMQRPSLLADLEEIKAKKDALANDLASANAEFNNIIEHLDELKQAESTCPVCTTELTPELKQQLIGKQKAKIIKLTKDKNSFSSELNNIKKELAKLEELAKKKNGLSERIAEIQKVCDEIASEISEKNAAEKVKSVEVNINNLRGEIDTLNEQKSLYDSKEQLNILQKQRSDAQANLSELAFSPTTLTDTENQYNSALQKVHELVSRQQSFDLLMSEKGKRKAELLEQQAKLANLLEAVGKCVGKVEYLTQFNNALLTTQESLRIDLISTVNEVMSNVWSDLYPYEKWSDIRLLASDADYNLQIFNGEWVSVAGFASGGERMLAALALRIAFAKVLAPHLSLLILDEPTHNLDQKAIDTFLEVLQGKLSSYLDQIFIITHDPKLAEAGTIIEI